MRNLILQSHILCQHSLKNVKLKSILSLKNLNLNHSQKKYQYKVFNYLDLHLHHHILHLQLIGLTSSSPHSSSSYIYVYVCFMLFYMYSRSLHLYVRQCFKCTFNSYVSMYFVCVHVLYRMSMWLTWMLPSLFLLVPWLYFSSSVYHVDIFMFYVGH